MFNGTRQLPPRSGGIIRELVCGPYPGCERSGPGRYVIVVVVVVVVVVDVDVDGGGDVE